MTTTTVTASTPPSSTAPLRPLAFPARPPVESGRLHVLMINGGGRKAQNFQSHLLHVRELLALLQRAAVPAAQISILSADGADPAEDLAVREVKPEGEFWLLRGTRLEHRLGTQTTYANSDVPGATLEPATRASVTAWFEAARTRLVPGDTLLLYVTDHGTKDPDGGTNTRITLWGDKESLSVTELRELLEKLDPGVRVVALMSQCYSGGFAGLVSVHAGDGLPGGSVCGYYSSTADRPAYGCYPENRGRENVGHSFHFLQALHETPRFPEAQEKVVVVDQTPDVPITSSSTFAAELLERAAEAAGEEPTPFSDRLLREAWRDKAAWEPEIRLLDRIGQAFGIFSPRSLAELEDQATRLPDISEQVKNYSTAWKGALEDLADANFDRFLFARPEWGKRTSDEALGKLDAAASRALANELLVDLAAYSRDGGSGERLAVLRQKSEAVGPVSYRMEVRVGVVLRMRALLTDLAARVYLAGHARDEERAAYAAVRACEDLALATALVERPPFPPYDDDVKEAGQVQPAWMGIRFRPPTPAQKTELKLPEGATTVITVYPDSPARAAGFELGDIVLGPPGTPFAERNQIREWTMLSAVDQPAPLEVLRNGERLQLTLVPKPYPQKWPELPGPPQLGSAAPPLALAAYRGTPPATLAGGFPHLLFFWATWCGPCKASLPEVLAYERDTHTPVIAISDEAREQLEAFFKDFHDPFPETVAIDEVRKTNLAYGVSGTPTFVLVDAEGKVRSHSTGYTPEKGLGIEGWTWAKKEGAKP